MAVRKVVEEAPIETPVEAPVVAPIETPVEAPKSKASKRTKYMSKKLTMAHPFQSVMMYPNTPVELVMDSWLDSQIKAGLVSECS
jgi:hypothetical protein